jgi:hypothetical protein
VSRIHERRRDRRFGRARRRRKPGVLHRPGAPWTRARRRSAADERSRWRRGRQRAPARSGRQAWRGSRGGGGSGRRRTVGGSSRSSCRRRFGRRGRTEPRAEAARRRRHARLRRPRLPAHARPVASCSRASTALS